MLCLNSKKKIMCCASAKEAVNKLVILHQVLKKDSYGIKPYECVPRFFLIKTRCI